MQKTIQTMYGLDASRRVAWARYYEKCEELEALRRDLEQLAKLILFHPRIHSQDEIIKIATRCLTEDQARD